MSARTLLYRSGTPSLFREIFYSLAQMGEEPLAAPYVSLFEKQRDNCQVILLQEIAILELLAKGQAAVDRADVRLDRFVRRVMRAVDDNTSGNTQKQLRKKLLKGKSEAKFRRPVLGRQLAEMADWSDVLEKCGVAALALLAPEAKTLYEVGKAADGLRAKAQSENSTFRNVGARKQFIDDFNGARKETEGALAKLPFQDPTLPQDFSENFFYKEPPRDEEETIADVKESILELKTKLAEEEERLAKMEQEAADLAKEEKEEQDTQQQAEALEAQAAALLEQAALLMKKKKK